MTDYTREELIAICEASIRPESVWHDRDSERAHRQVGEAWALLKAGCEFRILNEVGERHSLVTDEKTIWVEIDSKGFDYFEMHEMRTDHFYLPTRARLEQRGSGDWY